MFRQVLVPLDGSETAECVLPHLRNLVKEGSVGEITLLSVVGISAPWDADTVVSAYAEDETHLRQATEYLAKLKRQLTADGLSVKAEVLEGAAAQVIVDYAREEGVDLILMGTRGYSGIKRLMLGGVALHVAQESPCPVLLIKPECPRT